MQIEKIHSEVGFTLIEVLIAMVILSIGILALYTMQLHSIKGNFQASILTTESVLTTDRIEQFIGSSFTDSALQDGDGDGTNEDNNGDGVDDDGGNFGLDDVTVATADGNTTSPDGLYTIFWNVAVDVPSKNLKTIRVWVLKLNGREPVSISLNYIKDDII